MIGCDDPWCFAPTDGEHPVRPVLSVIMRRADTEPNLPPVSVYSSKLLLSQTNTTQLMSSQSTIEVADDTKTQVEQLAAGLEESPAEIRASIWQQIADADLPVSIDVGEFYESLVDEIYTNAVGGDSSANGEATASASASPADETSTLGDVPDRLNPWADDESLEEYDAGIQGDRTRDEYLEREEQVGLLADALERANIDVDGDDEE